MTREFAGRVVGTLLCVAWLPDGGAQTPPHRITETNTPAVRQDCRTAAAAMREHGLTAANAVQMRTLGQCRESGPEVLPQAWAVVRADSVTLQTLVNASGAIRDRRIALALERTATDEDRPLAVRQAALIALAGYLQPSLSGRVQQDTWIRFSLVTQPVTTSHSYQDDGSEPIDEAWRQRIVDLLSRLASPNPAHRLGYLAKHLLGIVQGR